MATSCHLGCGSMYVTSPTPLPGVADALSLFGHISTCFHAVLSVFCDSWSSGCSDGSYSTVRFAAFSFRMSNCCCIYRVHLPVPLVAVNCCFGSASHAGQSEVAQLEGEGGGGLNHPPCC